MNRCQSFLLALITVLFLGNLEAQDTTYSAEIIAPGYNKLTFEAPKAGSYTLAKYSPAGNGRVINMDASNK